MVMTVTGGELACPPSLGAEESSIIFSRGSSFLYRLFSKGGLWRYPILTPAKVNEQKLGAAVALLATDYARDRHALLWEVERQWLLEQQGKSTLS